jgi:hypothetical protein
LQWAVAVGCWYSQWGDKQSQWVVSGFGWEY